MGIAYALVHLKFTIPVGALLAFVHAPLRTPLDRAKLLFINTVAIVASIPWDSYLIRNKIWSYPDGGVLGPALWSIPVEEVFFFFIQTWCTATLYLLLRKGVLFEGHIQTAAKQRGKTLVGAAGLGAVVLAGARAWSQGGAGTYMGWILMCGGGVLLGLWTIAGQMVLALPLKVTAFPIALPTLCLWALDTLELRRGTWVIEEGTKLGIQPWRGMEIEEAVFFVVTNALIVVGLIAFDYGMALAAAFPSLFPERETTAGQVLEGFKAQRLAWQKLPQGDEYAGIMEAQNILKLKSRSFYLASGVFEGRLRLDLISLYSFCRAADDLIDEAPSPQAATDACALLEQFLDIAYRLQTTPPRQNRALVSYVNKAFPACYHAALLSLPIHRLPRLPLDGLLAGFRSDLDFPILTEKTRAEQFPIQTEADLHLYGERVAGTVGQMFTTLVLSRFPVASDHSALLQSAYVMGTALQYVNIARDVEKDAAIGRVYIPREWMDPLVVLKDPKTAAVQVREKLLGAAEEMYAQSRAAIEQLPVEARAGARVAVEAYMDIGRRLRGGEFQSRGNGTLGKLSRVWRAWKVMQE